MKTALELLKDARTACVLDHIFFGSLALNLKIVEDNGGITNTIATDGRSLLYSAPYVQQLTQKELVFLWAHEVMHCALNHHTRRGTRDKTIWNIAADHVINLILVDAGLTMPEGGYLDGRFKGMSAEQVYEILKREKEDEERNDPLAGMAAAAGGGSAGQQQAPDAQGGQSQPGQGSQGTRPGQGSQPGQNGNGARDLADIPGAVLDAPEPALDEAEWEVATQQAAMAARGRGLLPAGVEIAVREATKPRVDWREVLRQFVQSQCKSDYSWRMPNRRYIHTGIYLPEIRSEEMGPIVVIVDTSGSTAYAEMRAAFVGELQSIVGEVQPEAVIVLHCDAAVHKVERFERGDPLEITSWCGNGGTDFRPAFKCIEREQIEPVCAIYLTDGECNDYPEAPAFPVLWAVFPSPWSKYDMPWGEVIKIEA